MKYLIILLSLLFTSCITINYTQPTQTTEEKIVKYTPRTHITKNDTNQNDIMINIYEIESKTDYYYSNSIRRFNYTYRTAWYTSYDYYPMSYIDYLNYNSYWIYYDSFYSRYNCLRHLHWHSHHWYHMYYPNWYYTPTTYTPVVITKTTEPRVAGNTSNGSVTKTKIAIPSRTKPNPIVVSDRRTYTPNTQTQNRNNTYTPRHTRNPRTYSPDRNNTYIPHRTTSQRNRPPSAPQNNNQSNRRR